MFCELMHIEIIFIEGIYIYYACDNADLTLKTISVVKNANYEKLFYIIRKYFDSWFE